MQVTLAQSSFVTTESGGSVSVCIDISGGVELNRSVNVALSTQDGTAVCELCTILFNGLFASGYAIGNGSCMQDTPPAY